MFVLYYAVITTKRMTKVIFYLKKFLFVYD